jgi:hypothetical protein
MALKKAVTGVPHHQEPRAMLLVLLTAIIVLGMPTLYLAYRSREVRKFLAGAFFVSAETPFYLYLANVSVPLLGTSLVFTPTISGLRSIPHFIFFLLCLYFGFITNPKEPPSSVWSDS